MKTFPTHGTIAFFLLLNCTCTVKGADPAHALSREAAKWRADHRFIGLHEHINYSTGHLARAVRIHDAVGIGLAVNLSGGTVTAKPNGPSEFQPNKELADRLYPGRFLHYMNLDYSGWD